MKLKEINKFHLVFSAIRERTFIGSQIHVPFDVLLIDSAEGFDITKTFYTTKSSGFFFMHMSAGVPAYQRLQYTLQNASSTPNILLSHTMYNGELVVSRDDIQYINEGQTLYMSSTYSLYSDGYRQTTWSGFKLDDVVAPLILFSVARTTSYSTVNSFVSFDKILLNVGQAWDACNNRFVVPRSGVYFFSLSSASVPNTIHIMELLINNIIKARTFIHVGEEFNGIDTSSHSLLLPLNVGDIATVYLLDSGPIYSDNNYQTSFLGFLYESVHGQNIAWCFALPFDVYTNIYGPSSINFTEILLDTGSNWNATWAYLRISTSGTYYLHLSCHSHLSKDGFKLNLVLLLNGQPLMNVMEKSIADGRTNGNLRGHSLITTLQSGDELTVIVPTGYAAFNYRNDLMFSGFLIST